MKFRHTLTAFCIFTILVTAVPTPAIAVTPLMSESLESIKTQLLTLQGIIARMIGFREVDTPQPLTAGATVTAASCSQAAVAAAITAATEGDFVVIPAGSCNWSSGVTVSKYIHIQGEAGETVEITHNAGSSATLFTLNESTAGSISISNITFVQGTGGSTAWGGMFISVFGNTIATPTSNEPVLIYDNVFNQQGTARAIRFQTDGGVVWDNVFNNLGRSNVNAIAFAENTPNTSWATVDTMGTRDTEGKINTYIEDNEFNFYPAQALDPDSNSRVVIRNNTFNETGIASHGADTSTIGVRHWELYDNDFNFTDFGDCSGAETFDTAWYYYIRGGTGVITGNSMEDISSCAWSDKAEIYMTVQNIRRNAGPYACWETYPAPRQVGQGFDGSSMVTDPVYIWNNSGTSEIGVGNYNPDDCGNGLQTSDFIQEDRDYIVGTPKPSYTKYTYPHPLRSTVTQAEAGGSGDDPQPAPAPTASINANPALITSGNNSTLTWSSTDADSCTGTGFSTSNNTSGSVSVSPISETTYTVNCTGSGGSDSDTATVSVSAPPSGDTENIFGNLTTASSNADNQPWDLGMIFTPTTAGFITAARAYGATGESGNHTVRLWQNDGTLLSGPHDFSYSGTGWHEYTFPSPVAVVADTEYTIVVSTGQDASAVYALGDSPLNASGSNGQNLTYPAGAGVYSDTVGVRPTESYQNEHYMRDVVFEAESEESVEDEEAPSIPASLNATAQSASSITVTWNASTDNEAVSDYQLYRCAGTSCTPNTLMTTTENLSFGDHSLSGGTTYRYQVRARDTAGNMSSFSDIVSAETEAVVSGGGGGGSSSGGGGGGGSSSRNDDDEDVVDSLTTTIDNSNGNFSDEELELRAQLITQITELRTLISSLLAIRQAQSTVPATGVVSVTFDQALGIGMESEDVRQLQQALNSRGFVIAQTGPGSPGQETTFFGQGTLAALQRFQCQRLNICSGTPATTGYGNVGPSTRSALRQ